MKPVSNTLTRRKKIWGWGWEGEELTQEERKIVDLALSFFPSPPDPLPPFPKEEELPTPESRLKTFPFPWISRSPYDRWICARGKGYKDLVELRLQKGISLPDGVAFPTSPEEIKELLLWASYEKIAIVPFGGGTTVTEGIRVELPAGFRGVIVVALKDMKKIRWVSDVDYLVEGEGGVTGPELEDTLKPYNLTFRHYPQSYEFSTLGGWVATRSAGHYSHREGRIEERIYALEVVTPSLGILKIPLTAPLSSIGQDPNSLFIGSEGTLGIITSVVGTLKPTPIYRKTLRFYFPDFHKALEGIRAVLQRGISPAQIRALDEMETLLFGEGEGATVLVGVEGSYPKENELDEIARIFFRFSGKEKERKEGEGGYRSLFFRQPYIRDILVDRGFVAETFETGTLWRNAFHLYKKVREALHPFLQKKGGGILSARTTHTYPEGTSLYFTTLFPSREGKWIEDWEELKTVATKAILSSGGTLSHHHACGKTHLPWAEEEYPTEWWKILRKIKKELDPSGILNPWILIPP